MANPHNYKFLLDPLKFQRALWPKEVFYKEQQEFIYSVVDNDETYVPAANMMGKDYTLGFILTYFVLTRHPVRGVTTSAKDDHLRVLWAEINNWINTSKVPLKVQDGGPLLVQHQSLKKVVKGKLCDLSYLIGMVASPASIAAMQGHHIAKTGDGIPRTIFAVDEASSVDDEYMKMARSWANRIAVIGNTWDCENFFKHAIKGKPGTEDKGGDVPRNPDDLSKGYYRKVIRIKAEQSPNVQYGEAQERLGLDPDDHMVIKGVKSWAEYKKNRKMWDKIQQCVSLDADFYEGKELKLFPKEWIDLAEERASELKLMCKLDKLKRQAKAIGIDPAEGGDRTAMVAVDEYGIIAQSSRKTPNTADIYKEAIAFGRYHNVPDEMWFFDRGGGGKQQVDFLKELGYNANSIGFGESITLPIKNAKTLVAQKKEHVAEHYAYFNRRAEMYGGLSILLDPSITPRGFGIPREFTEFRKQMEPIPKKYDPEGRLKLPPKNKREEDSPELTLTQLIGYSPDELDALVLAVYGMLYHTRLPEAGAL